MNKLNRDWTRLAAAALMVSACGDDNSERTLIDGSAVCADGTDGDCQPADAGAPEPVCGNSRVEAGEACDDGNRGSGDGCSESCQVESGWGCSDVFGGIPCMRLVEPIIPEVPSLRFAPSMAPGNERFLWNAPEHTRFFEVLLDGAAAEGFDDATATRFEPRLSEGNHTLSVRACSQRRQCSEWAEGSVVVEDRGVPQACGLQGAGRELTRTALGRKVLVACDHCYGDKNLPVTLEGTTQTLRRAIATNAAAAVKLPVALVGDELAVIVRDGLARGEAPLLADVLALSVLADNTALLVLEVVEDGAPEAFVRALLDSIEAHPKLARNGRPLLLHANYARRETLAQLAQGAADQAVTGPYLRYVLGDDSQNMQGASLYDNDGSLRADLSFVDAVSLNYTLPNLFNRIARARKAERGVFVDGVPGPRDGEVVLMGLRDQVDGFFTSYNVAQARALIAAADVVTYVSAADAQADTVAVRSIRNGSAFSEGRALGTQPSSTGAGQFVPGTPLLASGTAASPWYGSALAFPDAQRWLRLSSSQVQPISAPGALLSAAGVFFGPSLDGASFLEGYRLEPASGQMSQIALGLSGAGVQAGTVSTNSFGSAISASPTGEPEGCEGSANGVFAAPLEPNRSYWLVYTIEAGTGASAVFIDGRCLARRSGWYGTAPSSLNLNHEWILGGTQSSGSFAWGFTGHIQQAQVTRFSSRVTDGWN